MSLRRACLEDSEVQGVILVGGCGGNGDVGVVLPVVVDQLLKVHAVAVPGVGEGRGWGEDGGVMAD